MTERVQGMRGHLDLRLGVFEEKGGCLVFRNVAPWYAKRVSTVKTFNKAVVRISTREDFESALVDYLDWRRQFSDDDGALTERYRQNPMMPSFMKDDNEPVSYTHLTLPTI